MCFLIIPTPYASEIFLKKYNVNDLEAYFVKFVSPQLVYRRPQLVIIELFSIAKLMAVK